MAQRNTATIIVVSLIILSGLLLGNNLVGLPMWHWLYGAEALVATPEPNQQEQTIATLSLQIADADQVKKENDSLRQMLGFYTKRNLQHKVGYVISRDQFNTNLITLDLGTDDGVQPGQPVVVKDGIIIAKIIHSESHVSVAELLTSEFSKLAVTTAASKETSGLLVGSLGNSLRLQYIPSSVELTQGQLVVSSGLENLVPAGLVVGTVEQIDAASSEVFKTAQIKPTLDYNQASLISIITQ